MRKIGQECSNENVFLKLGKALNGFISFLI